jgi:sodium/potassium-transporting ATPase subunit alpha
MQEPKDHSNVILGVVLLAVIFLLGTTQYLNERAAGSVAAQLRSLLPQNANVIRDGKEASVPASELVVGDVLHLTIGSRVPADVKILESRDLKLDFSALTGESNPIPMFAESKHDEPHESKNIAFMSSQVLSTPILCIRCILLVCTSLRARVFLSLSVG